MLIARCHKADFGKVFIGTGGKVKRCLEADAGCAGGAHGNGVGKRYVSGSGNRPGFSGNIGKVDSLTGVIGRIAVFPSADVYTVEGCREGIGRFRHHVECAVAAFGIDKPNSVVGLDIDLDIIEMQFQVSNNFNFGAALSFVLMILILICMAVMNKFGDTEEAGGVVA